MEKRPCVFCKTMLECAIDSWDSNQPYKGGEVVLYFGYGSVEHDHHSWTTTYRGLICDSCGSKFIPSMEEDQNHKGVVFNKSV